MENKDKKYFDNMAYEFMAKICYSGKLDPKVTAEEATKELSEFMEWMFKSDQAENVSLMSRLRDLEISFKLLSELLHAQNAESPSLEKPEEWIIKGLKLRIEELKKFNSDYYKGVSDGCVSTIKWIESKLSSPSQQDSKE